VIFSDKIEPACLYCANGKLLEHFSQVLCKKKGMVTADYHCGRFVYDPLKRVPKKAAAFAPDFSKDDFKI
jgi:hypothetical protein